MDYLCVWTAELNVDAQDVHLDLWMSTTDQSIFDQNSYVEKLGKDLSLRLGMSFVNPGYLPKVIQSSRGNVFFLGTLIF